MSTAYNPDDFNTSNPNPEWTQPTETNTWGTGQYQYGQQQYGQQQYGQYGQQQYGQPYGQMPLSSAPRPGTQGFGRALFDFSFSRFVTLDFVKVIYSILIAIIVIAWFVGLVLSFTTFSEGFDVGIVSLLGFLIVGTLGAFLWLILARVTLEFYVALIRTAQNTSRLVELEENRS